MIQSLTQMSLAYWRKTSFAQRILFITGSVLFVWMLVHIALMLTSSRPMSDPASYRKAATFAETGWLMCWSVAYALPYLRINVWLKWFITSAMLTFGIVETFLVSLQTWRGVPSHYNFATPLDSGIFAVMGVGAVYWLIAITLFTIFLFRENDFSPTMRIAYQTGGLLMLIGGVTGFMMLFNLGGIYQGELLMNAMQVISGDMVGDYVTTPHDAPGGNIVMVHALGVHGLNVAPLVAWLLGFANMPPQRQLLWSIVASMSYVLLTVAFIISASLQISLLEIRGGMAVLILFAAVPLVAAFAVAFTRGIPQLLTPSQA